MLEFRPKLWTALGAAVLLAGCNPGGEVGEASHAGAQHGEAGEAAAGETGGEGGGEQGEGGAAAAGLAPAEQQAFAVAQMRGHFAVAKLLAAAGAAQAASPHFGHPLYEVFEANQSLFAGKALDPAPFEALNAAAAAGDGAAALTPRYAAAEAAIATLAPAAYDRAAVAKALMALINAEYGEAVAAGKVVNAVEYQDAYSFALTLQELLGGLDGKAAAKAEALAEAEKLVALLPGPLPPETPPAPGAVLAQTSRIELALAGL